MESESKRRSGSFGSRKAVQASKEEARKLSLSEGSIAEKGSNASNISPGSSEAGTLKKPRKFKPRKFLAKRFKSKKSDDQEQNTAESGTAEQETTKKTMAAKLSEKLSSPKLQRFNFVKRFSGKKSYKVSPFTGSLDDDGLVDETKSNLRKLESLSVSESSVLEDVKNEIGDNESEPSTEIMKFEKESETLDVPATTSTSSKETVTLESKKVQLKITISGKKVERVGAASAVDKASPPTQMPIELPRTSTDIILPSTSTQVLGFITSQF